jgi:hypothetical protein
MGHVKGFWGPTAQAQGMESLKPWPKLWLLVANSMHLHTDFCEQQLCSLCKKYIYSCLSTIVESGAVLGDTECGSNPQQYLFVMPIFNYQLVYQVVPSN